MKGVSNINDIASTKEDKMTVGRYTDFFRKNYPALLFYATRFSDRKQAEDIVQDAFVDLWERRDKIDWDGNLRFFMYRSIYTRSLNRIKHRNVEDNYSARVRDIEMRRCEFLSPDNNEVMRAIDSQELGRQIESTIALLPQKCREVFVLSYQYGLKNMQIATVMEISLRTVEAHMYKALKFMREKLKHLI